MRKIAVPGAELPRTTAVLQEHSTAMLTFHLSQLFTNHLFRMRCPPCHTTFRRTEALLPMPGGLLKLSAALRAVIGMRVHNWRGSRGYGYRVALAIGLDCINRHAKPCRDLAITSTRRSECPDLFFLLLGHAFSPFQKAFRILPPGDKRRIAGIRTPRRIKKTPLVQVA